MSKVITLNSQKFLQFDMEELLKRIPDECKNNPRVMKSLASFASAKFPYKGPANEHVRATPLVEVFSVSIHSYQSTLFDDGKPCEVYGVIKATGVDGINATTDLYNRGMEETESVCLGNSLSLTGPSSIDCAIIPYPDTKLIVHLRDRARDIEIAQGQLDLDFRTEDESEAVKVEFVQGECGFAAVLYTTLRSAVVAQVEVTVLNREDQYDGSSGLISRDIYGSIVARCPNKYGFARNDDVAKDYFSTSNTRKECLLSVLFNEPLSRVHLGTPIKLSRSLVAVPAYSSVIFDVDLWDCGTKLQLVNDSAEFRAYHYGHWRDVKNLQGQDCVLQLLVTWGHAYMGISPRTLQNKSEDTFFNEAKEENTPNKQQKSLELRSGQSPIINGCRPSVKPKFGVGFPVMEVFSVFVGQNSCKNPSLYGTIEVVNAAGNWCIFDRDKKCPELLSQSSGRISSSALDQHRGIMGTRLGVEVDLKDTQSPLVIRGSIWWSDFALGYPLSWYDKRICSVIRGEHGYAAIHYTIFSVAVQAIVKVSVTSNDPSDDSRGDVCGSLVARYSNYSYSTGYENKYYRSVLFEKPRGNCSQRLSHELTLSKSVIAVPVDSCLIIDVDLHVSSSAGVHGGGDDNTENGMAEGTTAEHFKASAEFENVVSGGSCRTIKGHHYNLDFVIEWTERFIGEEEKAMSCS